MIAARPRAGLWLAVVALALLGRMLLPSGYMPAPAEGQAWRTILCTAYGVAEAYVDADGKLVDKPSEPSGEQQPCAFAGVTGAFLAPTPLALPAILPVVVAPVLASLTLGIGYGLPAPPPPSTGPPHDLSA